MTALKQLLGALVLRACVFLVIFTELVARTGMGAAFAFKKNKSRLKKEEAQRSYVYKILGFYHFSGTNAPHHMKKYAIIRICNLISFILATVMYFCIPYFPNLRLIFAILLLLHALFLFGTPCMDAIILSDIKKYGKMPNFDRSKKT